MTSRIGRHGKRTGVGFKASQIELPSKRLAVKESDLLRTVQRWLQVKGVEWWRMPIGPVIHHLGGRAFWKPSPLKGFPDLCGVLTKTHRGVLWAIELKSASGKVSPEQATWIVRLQQAGCAVTVARSVEDVAELMRRWGEVS